MLTDSQTTDQFGIEVEGLSMTYELGRSQSVQTLREIDLVVPAGQLLCVFGPSGSGKTTLLNLLAGLRRPTSGTVRIGGTDLGTLSEDEAARFRRRHIGIVYQFFNLSPMLTVEENVALPLLFDGARMRDLEGRVFAVLERLGLPQRRRGRVDELSGGELQRVAIARALLAEPRVILADEPTGNLDTKRGLEVLALLRELVDDRAITTVLMTHDARATQFADRVIAIRNGRIDEDVSPVRLPRSQ